MEAGKTIIVGAGIVGLATALQLQADGHRVLLLDPAEPASGCSSGNAGNLAESEIFPLAEPGIWHRLPRMLLDPMGPLVIRMAYLPRLIPWGLRFLAAARPGTFTASTAALASLNQLAVQSYLPLLQRAGAGDLVTRQGGLVACRTRSMLDSTIAQIPLQIGHGIPAEALSPGALRELEPGLSPDLAGGVYYPSAARCADPQALGTRFAEAILRDGGEIRRAEVLGLTPAEDGSWQIMTDQGVITAQRVVITAGVWSGKLMRHLGYKAPIETERGYHLMLPAPNVTLHRPCIMAETSFCVTPMNHGLRLAGTVEMAGIKAPMNPRRSDILFDLAKPYLPGLDRSGATRWMGFRPSFPDSRPAIGRAARHRNLTYAFGHQHLGLTQAAITGRCIADLVADRPPPIDLAPFSLARFG
ncbi:MAG TPA: FAD-dependent oxidoreductase [Stellaceae bacterium]|nr:FAD-dependent oxidoreductase [Stellaceae bacterium]